MNACVIKIINGKLEQELYRPFNGGPLEIGRQLFNFANANKIITYRHFDVNMVKKEILEKIPDLQETKQDKTYYIGKNFKYYYDLYENTISCYTEEMDYTDGYDARLISSLIFTLPANDTTVNTEWFETMCLAKIGEVNNETPSDSIELPKENNNAIYSSIKIEVDTPISELKTMLGLQYDLQELLKTKYNITVTKPLTFE